ncbi:Uncharacterised protein [Klebsiella pneumoniae]|nr:Uncharacterised protein [Klebsiella pneumoniae]
MLKVCLSIFRKLAINGINLVFLLKNFTQITVS